MALTYRVRNGAPLTWAQVDENFRTLDTDKVSVRPGFDLSQENFTPTYKLALDNLPSNLEFRLEQAEDNAAQAAIDATAANQKASIVVAPDEADKGPGAIPYDQSLGYPGWSLGAAVKAAAQGTQVLSVLAGSDGSTKVGFIQSGLGVVARNIQDRMRERVSVKDFAGVVGDGIHDDTAGIQAAINDGRPLDFGGTENVYRITADLIPKNGGRYYGYGATIFQESIGEEAFACTVLTDAKFYGLTLVGASPDPLITDGTNRAFELFAPKDVVIELCTMKNWGSAGVFLTGGGGAAYGPTNCKVLYCLIENCNDGIFIYVGGAGNEITGNTIRRSGRTGIFIDDVSFSSGGTPVISTMLDVCNNIIESYGGFAEAAGITSGAIRRVNISKNIIGPGNGAGISLFAGGAEADPPTTTNALLVDFNQIYRPSKQAIVLVGVQYSQVVHNMCWEPCYGATGNNSAIELQAMTRAGTTVGSDKNIIESNTVVRGAGDVDNGVRLQANCSNNRVRLNIIEGATSKGVLDEGAGNKVSQNEGFKTENSGTASITTGTTFVDVTHGLDYTPAVQDITITLNSSLGSATYWLISGAPTATTFRIALNANPGATVNLAWSVRKN
ncbi:right-handed parallel beta-helix repeat-containing protein [Pseudomonas sp. DCB_BI]|uniref:right-handed parallel beta-helix repeat-containing protein n=1 Tax=Pseudomonas sp. DCB_BI TaxID=2993594 RepID=UPI00224A94A3|nr:right-handed parallel beta-helix repeat-containing protein [Pseudomonas sp. DCB_BI]MCX2891710.1 right-handed parallel beta-helix repeat-containing protein [Pseudomonas sp. DCB_BI]